MIANFKSKSNVSFACNATLLATQRTMIANFKSKGNVATQRSKILTFGDIKYYLTGQRSWFIIVV